MVESWDTWSGSQLYYALFATCSTDRSGGVWTAMNKWLFWPVFQSVYKWPPYTLPRGRLPALCRYICTIYAPANSPSKPTEILTACLDDVHQWLQHNHPVLNLKKTVYMCSFIRKDGSLENVKIKIRNEKIKEVNDFKFLGIILDPQLKFDKHVKKIIRHYIPTQAAQLFMHCMIFSDFSYCMTVWAYASPSTIRHLTSLYNPVTSLSHTKKIQST